MKSFCTSLFIFWFLSSECFSQSLLRANSSQIYWQHADSGTYTLQPSVTAWTGDHAGMMPAGKGHSFTITAIAGMNGNELYYDANGDGVLDADEKITAYTTILNYVPGRIYIKFSGDGYDIAVFQYADGDAPAMASTIVSPSAGEQPMADIGEKSR